jgi:hypothetical protein
VAHTCNPSYSRGRDQEDRGTKSAQANSSRPHLIKTHHKKELVELLKVKALSPSPGTKKKKNIKIKNKTCKFLVKVY